MDKFQLNGLIRRASDGDISVLEKIFSEMKDSIYSIVLMHVGNRQAAEDILQETMLEIFYSAKNYKRFDNPKAWILTIARNKAISFFRTSGREVELDENIEEIPKQESLENQVGGNLNVLSMLSELPLEEREIVILHAISGLKHKEISKLLNIPLGTVCWKYNESIKKLRQFTYSE